MAAEVTIFPESGDITAGLNACRISVTGAEVNNTDGTQHRYRFRVTPPASAATEFGSSYSHLFNVNSEGEHTWDNVIFPEAGTWTVRLYDEEDESDVDSLSVTVD